MRVQSSGIDLTKGSIVKNLVTLSLPIMLSNFMQTFYDLANAFWLGKLGENAKEAVSAAGITMPIVFFLASFGFGFVIAGTAMTARYKGANEPEKIKKIIGQLIFILLTFITIILVLSLVFIDQILSSLSTPKEIFSISKGYMSITLISAFFMFTFFFYQGITRGLGNTITPMKAQLVSIGLNILLDPFFIFGISFFPRLETIGAAYTSLIARALAAVLGIYLFSVQSKDLIPQFKDIIPKWDLLKTIFKVSIPSSLSISTTSFGFVILQGFVNSYGTVPISINSVGNRMINFFMMPAMGFSQGLAAIIGQNLGAKDIKRAEKSISYAFLLIMPIMIIGSIFVYLFAAELTRFFINDPEVIEAGKRMFKLTAISALVFGILFIFNGIFNGSGDTKVVMVLDITRLFVLRIPFVYILSGKLIEMRWFSNESIIRFLELISGHLAAYPYDALWWSMVYSNIVSAICAYLVYRTGRWKRVKI